MTTKGKTVKQFLTDLASTNQSDEADDHYMQLLLKCCGESKAVVTCGMVYLDGKGQPIDIHTISRELLKRS